MPLTLSCAFATSNASHEHARIAEELGFARAWFYDSPALYPDVWVQLCRAAERTSRIGLGPGVLVPTLRHPMANAAAIATLVSIAGPERVAVGIGSGFTGRLTLGQRPVKWSRVSEYVGVLRALLRGEEVEWEGGVIRMLHPDGYGAACPIHVPFVIGAAGPKGIAAARALGDGVFGAPVPIPGFDWSIVLTFGTVLAAGEDPGSPRVLDAAGHAAPVFFHFALENRMTGVVPRQDAWAAAYAEVPERVRHLALHDRHLIAINERDRPFVTAELLAQQGLALTPAGWRERIALLESQGATEIAYQPAGPDIPRELEAFASAVPGRESVMKPQVVMLAALVGVLGAGPVRAVELPPSEETAKARLEASPRHGELATVGVDGTPVRVWIVYPERKEKAPVVLVIHEIFGLTDWVRAVADQLAAEGFLAVAPDLLSGKGAGGGGTETFPSRDDAVKAVSALARDEVIRRLDAVRTYALARPAASGKSASIGFCWGGATSFAYAVAQPALDASVVYYGTPPEDLAALKAPVLGLYGGNDARVDATIEPTRAKLKRLGKVYEPHVFEGAGHGFLRAQDGQEGANRRASEEAWPLTIAFLRDHTR